GRKPMVEGVYGVLHFMYTEIWDAAESAAVTISQSYARMLKPAGYPRSVPALTARTHATVPELSHCGRTGPNSVPQQLVSVPPSPAALQNGEMRRYSVPSNPTTLA